MMVSRKNKRNLKRNIGSVRYMSDRIEVRVHVIDRYMERAGYSQSRAQIKGKVVSQVRQGRLITLRGNEEVYEYRGMKYVCKREKDKWGPKLVVVTMKISQSRQRTRFSDDLSVEHIDYRALGVAR